MNAAANMCLEGAQQWETLPMLWGREGKQDKDEVQRKKN